jgi:hypothetical protein
MPIINKGIFDTDTVFTRQTGNDWPTAQVISTADVTEASSNLYFTNTRVVSALIAGTAINIEANGRISANVDAIVATTAAQVLSISNFTTANLIESSVNLYFTNSRVVSALIPGTGISIEANGRISANVDAVQVATQVNNLDNLTTANLVEGTNLYYTNTRARTAFTAGRGIIITDDGIVKSTIGSELFNPAINYAKDYNVTASMAAGLTIPSTPVNDRYIIRSLHVTNISDSVAFVSSNVLYAGGNTAYLGSLIPVPIGSIVEFMDRPQLLQPGDRINLQGFDASQTATSGLLSSYFTYESISSDVTYVGTGQTLALSNTTIQVVHADQSDTIIESLKVVNLKTHPIPVKVFFGYSNATPKAYMAFNMQVPPNTSIELLQSPKLILQNDKIYASYANASDGDAISIFPSYRQGSVTNLGNATPSASSGGIIDVSFYTTLVDGTTLYYTLE